MFVILPSGFTFRANLLRYASPGDDRAQTTWLTFEGEPCKEHAVPFADFRAAIEAAQRGAVAPAQAMIEVFDFASAFARLEARLDALDYTTATDDKRDLVTRLNYEAARRVQAAMGEGGLLNLREEFDQVRDMVGRVSAQFFGLLREVQALRPMESDEVAGEE